MDLNSIITKKKYVKCYQLSDSISNKIRLQTDQRIKAKTIIIMIHFLKKTDRCKQPIKLTCSVLKQLKKSEIKAKKKWENVLNNNQIWTKICSHHLHKA